MEDKVSVIEDFYVLIEDVIKTQDEIKKLKSPVFRLLFTHLCNGFDTMISKLPVALMKDDISLVYSKFRDQTKTINKPITIDNLIEVQEIGGVDNWLTDRLTKSISENYRGSNHAERLKTLLEILKIDATKHFVVLSSGVLSSKKPAVAPNNKTQPNEVIGFADVLFEKRNAIVHNKNKYSSSVITRLNENWDLNIEIADITTKNTTINTAVRFYVEVCSLIEKKTIETKKFKILFKKYFPQSGSVVKKKKAK